MEHKNTPPKGQALVVGLTHIDEQVYGNDGRNGCKGCGIDAATISEALLNEGFEVDCLIDEKATSSQILTKIKNASEQTQPGETYFFFFAGHGGQTKNDQVGGGLVIDEEDDGMDETLLCFDREIVDDELKACWEKFPAGSVIYMISDSCNSGTNARLFNSRDKLDPVPIEYQEPSTLGGVDEEWPELKARVLHMGGCRDGFTSVGEADGGVFTKALVRAWKMGHGKQTWQELFEAAIDTITTQDPRLNVYGYNGEGLSQARPFTPYTEASSAEETVRSSATDRYGWDEETRNIGNEYSDLINDDDASDRDSLLRSGVLRPDALEVDETRGERGGLPISESAARRATRFLMENFGPELAAAGEGTVFGPEVLSGIVCQETAYFWLPIWDKLKDRPEFQETPEDLVDLVVARCVLDASGDYPGTSRRAYPQNGSVFRRDYGTEFASMLIGEANETRALRGYSARNYLYKGYGIFQYDLQFVKVDESFFRDREWYDFTNCLNHCMGELKDIYARTRDKWETIRKYNGRGDRARRYRDNVKIFSRWANDEIQRMSLDVDLLSGSRSVNGSRNYRGIKPSSSPRLKKETLESYLSSFGHQIDRNTHPLIIVGIRGYYLDSMGRPGENERGHYDDAIFILSEDGYASYNGNTDPSRYKKGTGTGSRKGRARLKPGLWMSYKFDTHYGSATYPAICQRLDEVTVIRDGYNGDYEDPGMHGINIHRGGYSGTSSLGCQTIYPTQWNSFYQFGKDLAKRYFGNQWNDVVIPYVLLEETEIRKLQGDTMT